ncbi:hypothetical protein [Legionella hackeliae]|uniref:Uncharacterized protein n=1 Tax=Legionella hackeliae TaxID=449 RepID=A0A0A8UQU0_LEGHA|nr:hypothetical protein [Legionella hackeliae]KTD15402.1 hypothetical protein Lhac_0244 [Legionella hackeliae]CEK11230.1 protein of unknown function [Legionella hackeliae]STX47995.1 Uncharacterised protein [Legionella hackeliae]
MPMYEDLQRDAKNFTALLTHALTKRATYGNLFFTCLPSPIANQQLFDDANLIQQTAECLDFYAGVTHSGRTIDSNVKHQVLIGIYVYVWYQYDSLVQSYLNKPLLKLFQDHLGVSSLEQFEPDYYRSCLDELDDFCNWVFEKREQYQQTNKLFQIFPTNMQGSLHVQKNAPGLSWGTLFSGLMTKVGIKSLF